jgi:serine/threonine-protein kinase
MTVPQLTIEQISALIPSASNIQLVDRGGQKIVFSGIIDGRKYAIKFMAPNISQTDFQYTELVDEVTMRAQREVETMKQCSSSHLVSIGPIGLNKGDIDGQPIIYFSEEFIEGLNLWTHLKDNGPLSITDVVRLATHISEAIKEIWKFSKIHRDIKPQNIMKRSSNGEFVLLDMGLVFDLEEDSLSNMFIVGTKKYFSPEQMDYINRRTRLTFRSDLFSLGIVLYEMVTGVHPFISHNTGAPFDVLRSILNNSPIQPLEHREGIPEKLNKIIMRLLDKRPALRYRSIEMFQSALNEVDIEGGE